ncbi:ArsR/SmtB family transcription factor, partial [Streptomyces scabiei]
DFLKALANPWRLRILCAIAEGPLAVGALARRIGAREALVSQHLTRLRAEGLVRGERNGHNVTYTLASGPAAEVIAALHRAFCAR